MEKLCTNARTTGESMPQWTSMGLHVLGDIHHVPRLRYLPCSWYRGSRLCFPIHVATDGRAEFGASLRLRTIGWDAAVQLGQLVSLCRSDSNHVYGEAGPGSKIDRSEYQVRILAGKFLLVA